MVFLVLLAGLAVRHLEASAPLRIERPIGLLSHQLLQSEEFSHVPSHCHMRLAPEQDHLVIFEAHHVCNVAGFVVVCGLEEGTEHASMYVAVHLPLQVDPVNFGSRYRPEHVNRW